jgi:hypothetical protein
MADSQEIRSHVIKQYVDAARIRGDRTVTVHVGDVVGDFDRAWFGEV